MLESWEGFIHSDKSRVVAVYLSRLRHPVKFSGFSNVLAKTDNFVELAQKISQPNIEKLD